MADTLTQEQIDAMLNSALAGDVIETHEEVVEAVKAYDFRAPKKFTKEKIKTLNSIFDSYARLMSSYFTGLLRLYCKVSIVDVEEQRYFEFNNALPDYVMMGLVDLGIKDPDLEEFTTIIQLSNTLTFTMIDRLLGGRGDAKEVDRDFTEIETSIMKNILSHLAKLLKEPWETYVELSPELIGIETNARVISSVGYDDTMIIIALEVMIGDASNIISVCVPALNLDEVMQKFTNKTSKAGRRPDLVKEQERKDILLDTISSTYLDVTAVLGETTLDLSDVMGLQINDVIPLGKSIDSNIVLTIGGKPWFDGKLGIFNHKKAIKIDNVLGNEVS